MKLYLDMQVVRKRVIFKIARTKIHQIFWYRNMILSSILTLLKDDLSHLQLFLIK